MEPFKHWINVDVIVGIASHFAQHSKEFDLERFVAYCFHNLENLELKARTIHLAHGMNKFLPADYYLATRVIQKSLGPVLKDAISGGEVNSEGVGGWALMAFAEYVALYGQKHPDISFNLLQEITRRGSAEFAIRYFLRAQPELTLSVLKSWLDHEDHHVRRLISEGTRP